MNDLERRLRAALEARAQTIEASPHAWQRLQRRTRRRSPARWLLLALPAALVAVFVPILLSGGLGRNSAADPDELYRRLMRDRTPAGETVTLDGPSHGGAVRLWFARGDQGQPEFCRIVERGRQEPYGYCHPLRYSGHSGVLGWYEGTTRADAAAAHAYYGLATANVAQATAVLEGGRTVPARLHRPKGLDVVLWTLELAAGERVSRVEVADAGGRRSTVLPGGVARSKNRGAPTGAARELPDGITARLYGRDEISWFRHGLEVGAVPLAANRLPEALGAEPVDVRASRDGALLYGVTREDVARFELTVAGAPIVVRPTARPWGLRLGVYAATLPDASFFRMGGQVAAFDAAGEELWRKRIPPSWQEHAAPGRRLGEAFTVPGTEDFTGGPVRLWFEERRGRVRELCHSGGATPEGDLHRGCGEAELGPDSFTYDRVVRHLPLPGSTIAFGPARAGWVSVDAVTADGRRIPGTIVRPEGAPNAAWLVRHPSSERVAAYAFTVRGSRLEEVHPTDPSACWDATESAAAGHALPGGLTARLHPGACLKWWKDGKQQPGASQPLPGTTLSSRLTAGRPVEVFLPGERTFYGFALRGTARVVITLKGGGRVSADAAPDPWGQGVALFGGQGPGPVQQGEKITGYAAGGDVLWTYRLPG
ncbi:hypothetical protein [Nonomuraea indica]|uniref:hypothetical protein n=1 Tax=Nonomuraea indica TaxID=1581193 RepID=UPI000C7BDB99|nr:hypothetical protein [Nonomuraea indica]